MRVLFYKTRSGRMPVKEFISDLAKPDQARFIEVVESVERFGLGCPRVQFRQLRGKLWEIKFSGIGGGCRVAYVLLDKEQMIWLHAFKKEGQKTPLNDIRLAEKRMKEVVGT